MLVAQSCPTLCDPMDWGLLGSSVHSVFQVRILQWVATLLQGIFLTKGLNSDLLQCKQISLPSEPPGKPELVELYGLSTHFLEASQMHAHHPCKLHNSSSRIESYHLFYQRYQRPNGKNVGELLAQGQKGDTRYEVKDIQTFTSSCGHYGAYSCPKCADHQSL